ncbi:MAG: polysaccharide deacetylase family protein [Bacteriovoracaceae bacterium]|nr:polysaccharide deacetylase family protein [Bacteriovoracaceae bacterium]
MRIFIFLLFVSFNAFATFAGWDQYPEDRTYTQADRGMRPYRAVSLYKSGTFTLTFDDGPDQLKTPKVLDILKKYDVKATFFVLTNLINSKTFPLIKRMLDEGHIVASHGPSHDRSGDLSKDEWKRQTKLSFLELAKWYKLAGHEFSRHYYRFPYGSYGTRNDYHHINALKEVSHELMGENCIHMVFWDVDTSDWVPGMTPAEVAQNIIAWNEGGTYIDFKREGNTYVKVPMEVNDPIGGGVVLQHDVQTPSIEGLDIFLKYVQERNIHTPRLDEVEEFKITKNCRL